MAVKLYNTLTKQKSNFVPLNGNEVRIYSCGPTVYSYAHIGNFRTYIFMDNLRRMLEYNGYTLKHVMNITDVGHLESDSDEGEDKMEKAAKKENKDPYEKTGLTTIGTGIFRDGSNIVNIATGAVAESGYWYAEDFWEVGDKLVQCNGDYQGDMIVYTSDDLKECARKHFYSIIEVGNFGQGKIFMEYELVDEQTRRGFFNENLEEVIDLSELEITNKPIFKDGYAGLVIRDKWYTVIDENGEMQFEPVEMENDPLCFNLGDKRFYIESNGKGMIIDEKNNVIAQLTTRMKSDNGSYYYSDGYIVGLTNEFINANGEKLTVYMKK